MTSQKDQIRRLIAEIEATLAKPASRLPLGLSGEAERQRQLLGKLFDYLQSLEQTFESPGGWGPLDPGTGQLISPQASTQAVEESASHVLQGLLVEMRYLRENSLKPMRQELETLQQKRDSIQAEVNVLEAQRSADPLQSEEQISAFLETLMQRLQEQLSAQMVQNFAAMEAAAVEQLSTTDTPAPLLSGQRLEQVRLLQAQSDQLLVKLDSTLTAVFDSLQKSIDSYRESLEEGLNQMHGLGRQGEVIFHAFVNHLAQQLGQDASSYLTGDVSEQQGSLRETEPSTTDVDLDPEQLDDLDQALENLALAEEIGDTDTESVVELDSDLVLDEIDEDEDITLIQTNDPEPDLELLDGDFDLDIDEEITLIQTGDLDLAQSIDLEEEITIIQTDTDELDPDLAVLEAAIASSDNLLDNTVPELDTDDALPFENADTEPNIEDIELDTTESPAADSFNLEASLGDLDENLGLLAIGTESDNALLGSDESTDEELLPPIDLESGLFNLSTSFDAELPETPQSLIDSSPQPSQPEESVSETGQLSDDLLAFSFANDSNDSEESDLEAPEQTSDISAEFDIDQVANSWLFDQANEETESTSEDEEEFDLEAPIPETTVQNLFGDSIADDVTPPDDGTDDDTVTTLSDLLPSEPAAETVDDFPENIPEDVYIAAAADEDLINLVEPNAEQRLLIDFDDGKLIEQLDEDLQKLAGENFSADYDVDEDDALEPLDQDTLETIVRDLNLEDLDLDDEAIFAPKRTTDSKPEDSEINADGGASVTEASSPAIFEQLNQEDAESPEENLDLFDGFTADTIDVDDPSANDIEFTPLSLDSNESPIFPEIESDSQELDLLGLGIDPLEDLDDAIPDSLADELDDLSDRSNELSQAPADDSIGQLLSDFEEPVISEDEADLLIPAVEETEPNLDSSSMPDLPSDFLTDELGTESPESDDFLQEEQQAFWQTMSVDESTSEASPASSEEPETRATSVEPEPETGTVLDTEADTDLDDLLLLDNLPLPNEEPVSEEELDLGDLDDLFGPSSFSDLAALDSDNQALIDSEEATDPLQELGLDVTPTPEALIPAPDSFPETSVPDTETVAAEVDIVDSPAVDSEATTAPPAVLTPIAAPPVNIEGTWFLGLDVGSTGLSAVLMNRRTGQVYPLYWQAGAEDIKHFRLPTMAIMTAGQDTVAVGYDALGDLEDLLDTVDANRPELIGVNRFKSLLKVAVGHGQTLPNSDPWLRWTDTVELPMLQVLQAMVALLKHLVQQGQAVGLDSNGLSQIWERLQGVIVGYPTNWPDTYSFNLREAILAAELVEQPGQILFVEDAIATILSGLPDPNDIALSDTVSLSRQPSLYNCQWQEGTVVISAGATMTELGLVNLPSDLTTLNYADFSLRSFAYAGDALDQDIVCQLLLPEERRQPIAETDTHWDWQGHLSAADADWSRLNLDDLTLPAVGHVDWVHRYRLQQRLLSSSLGQSLLAAARHLKLALQQQNQLQITLAGQQWLIKRRHIENLIFLPYVQRINRYLNVMLSNQAIDAQAIKQVICTGGSASLPAIARWLRQKFPNATIIQDTYASELPQSCSRVAYGLVNLARYPQVLNVTRQQYSDYFLLMELLRVFPQQPLPVGAIMHLLEQRGINTQACHLHILALLEGHLPPGLVPTTADRGLICDRTADLPTYRALLQTPLFRKTVTESGSQIYIPNEAQAEQLRAYFNRILLNKVQTLEEPLIAQLEVLT